MGWWWWVREKQQEEANESALGLFGIKRRDDRRRWKKKTWKKKLRRMKNHFKCFLTLEILHQTENVSWELKNICTHSRAKRQPVPTNTHRGLAAFSSEAHTTHLPRRSCSAAAAEEVKKWNEIYIKKAAKIKSRAAKESKWMNVNDLFKLHWLGLFFSALYVVDVVCAVFFSVVANSSFSSAALHSPLVLRKNSWIWFCIWITHQRERERWGRRRINNKQQLRPQQLCANMSPMHRKQSRVER